MRKYNAPFLHYNGVYDSYWANRLGNIFVKKGKKKLITKHINFVLIHVKLAHRVHPLVFLFEVIESIKPVFKLENTFPSKKGVIFPRVITRNKQYGIAIKWIKLLILDQKHSSKRDKLAFWKQLYVGLVQLSVQRSNPLVKKRDEYHKDAVNLQENIRYTWRS